MSGRDAKGRFAPGNKQTKGLTKGKTRTPRTGRPTNTAKQAARDWAGGFVQDATDRLRSILQAPRRPMPIPTSCPHPAGTKAHEEWTSAYEAGFADGWELREQRAYEQKDDLRAIELVLGYFYGKPRQAIEIEADGVDDLLGLLGAVETNWIEQETRSALAQRPGGSRPAASRSEGDPVPR